MTVFRRWVPRGIDDLPQRVVASLRSLAASLSQVGLQAGGSNSDDGDNSTTVFSWAHDLEATPTVVSVTAGSADADGDFSVTVDATNITVTYGTAPVTGTGNLTWWWTAGFTGA